MGTAQKGLDIILAMSNGASVPTYTPVAGMRTASLAFNKEQVDVSSADSVGRWRELLAGATIKSLSASGSGVVKDDAIMQTIMQASLDDTFDDWQLTIPGIGAFTGPLQVNISFGGEHAAEATYDMSLESAGVMAFVAEA